MDAAFFDYELPKSRIAERPSSQREEAKLLHAKGSEIVHRSFSELPNILRPGDLLVLNNTQVLPCRFLNGNSEVFILGKEGKHHRAIARPLKRFKPGLEFALTDGVQARVIERDERTLLLEIDGEPEGRMPIPPYIRGGQADEDDKQRYQTVYAKEKGSVAAPTAGLHFTPEILYACKQKGIEVLELTLHLGAGSFRLIEGSPSDHKMVEESFSADFVPRIEEAKRLGQRIVAVGTSSVRALESAAVGGLLSFGSGRSGEILSQVGTARYATRLYIQPPNEFEVVDAMVTNFHQPRSTHLLMVGAFFGAGRVRAVYKEALGQEYRFLSYGDSMFLEKRTSR